MLFALNQIYPQYLVWHSSGEYCSGPASLPKTGKNHTGDCKHLTKNARQSFFGHPCLLSLNPLRESTQLLLLNKKKGISVDQLKTLLPLSNHCFSQTSELDKRRCILSEVVPESAFKYYCELFNRCSCQNSGFDVFDLETWICKYSLLMVTVPRYPK